MPASACACTWGLSVGEARVDVAQLYERSIQLGGSGLHRGERGLQGRSHLGDLAQCGCQLVLEQLLKVITLCLTVLGRRRWEGGRFSGEGGESNSRQGGEGYHLLEERRGGGDELRRRGDGRLSFGHIASERSNRVKDFVDQGRALISEMRCLARGGRGTLDGTGGVEDGDNRRSHRACQREGVPPQRPAAGRHARGSRGTAGAAAHPRAAAAHEEKYQASGDREDKQDCNGDDGRGPHDLVTDNRRNQGVPNVGPAVVHLFCDRLDEPRNVEATPTERLDDGLDGCACSGRQAVAHGH
mmetsp:Transcript_83898/g.167461  ORF Transcript_83898/g.167461 Transcript_83898/m.167461 type:complete len:299 (+) Transcript_83898:684-1580(+)